VAFHHSARDQALQYLVRPWGETSVQRDRSALDMLGIRRSANILTYSASLTPYSASRSDSFALEARTTCRRAWRRVGSGLCAGLRSLFTSAPYTPATGYKPVAAGGPELPSSQLRQLCLITCWHPAAPAHPPGLAARDPSTGLNPCQP
jgi:hypothetical protein